VILAWDRELDCSSTRGDNEKEKQKKEKQQLMKEDPAAKSGTGA
jgi:hypothetical protein